MSLLYSKKISNPRHLLYLDTDNEPDTLKTLSLSKKNTPFKPNTKPARASPLKLTGGEFNLPQIISPPPKSPKNTLNFTLWGAHKTILS